MNHKPNHNLLQIGTRVKLSEHTGYGAQSSNPKVGSKYECVGTVCEINYSEMSRNRSFYSVSVEWENGTRNSYRPRDLIILDTGFISIWDDDITIILN